VIKVITTVSIVLLFISCRNGQKREHVIHKSENKEDVSVKTVKNIEKTYGKKINVEDYVLSQDNDMFFERISTIIVFGKTTNSKLFKGPVMWFKNYFNERATKKDNLNTGFREILTQPQEEYTIKEIVGEDGVFQPDQKVLLDSVKSLDYLVTKFLERKDKTERLVIKPIFLESTSIKNTIGYLFYLKGYVVIDDDYEPETFFVPIGQVY